MVSVRVRVSCRSVVSVTSFKDAIDFPCFERRKRQIRRCTNELHPCTEDTVEWNVRFVTFVCAARIQCLARIFTPQRWEVL